MTVSVYRKVGTMYEYIGRDKHTWQQITHDHPSRTKHSDMAAGMRDAANAYFDHVGELVVEDEATGERRVARISFVEFNGPGADRGPRQ